MNLEKRCFTSFFCDEPTLMLLILSVSLVLLLVAVDGEVGCSLSCFPSIYVGAGTEGVLVGDEHIAAHPFETGCEAEGHFSWLERGGMSWPLCSTLLPGALPPVQTSTPQAMPASGAVRRTPASRTS